MPFGAERKTRRDLLLLGERRKGREAAKRRFNLDSILSSEGEKEEGWVLYDGDDVAGMLCGMEEKKEDFAGNLWSWPS
jgi:hypothetical protein